MMEFFLQNLRIAPSQIFDRVVNTPLLCTGFNTEKYKTEKFRIRNCAGKIINQYGEGNAACTANVLKCKQNSQENICGRDLF